MVSSLQGAQPNGQPVSIVQEEVQVTKVDPKVDPKPASKPASKPDSKPDPKPDSKPSQQSKTEKVKSYLLYYTAQK